MASKLAEVTVFMSAFERVRLETYFYSTGFAPGIAPHAHDEWQVCYSPSAGGHLRTGRTWQEARPGRLYFIPPTVEHTGARDATVERPSTYYVLYLSQPHVDPREREGGAPVAGTACGHIETWGPTALHAMRRLIHGVRRGMGTAEVEDEAHRLLAAALPNAPFARTDDTLARRVRDALLADQVRCATLAELAGATGATPHRVRAAFKAAYGIPPARYHLMQRLSAARGMIRSGVAAATVASRLGFVDQSHLTHRLRRYFGHPPGSILGG